MGIKDRLQGSFSTLPPFADALSAGVQDELRPLFDRMAALEAAITQLGGQVSSATNTANNAARTADEARRAATQPTPSPTPSSTTPSSDGTTGGTSTGNPAVTPQPTPSPSSRPTLLVIALPNPIFIGDILAGNTRPPATIGVSPREGAFYVGSLIDLSLSSVDDTVEFVNWTNSAGEVLGGSPTLTTTVTEANQSIVANFRDKPVTTGGGTTGTGGGTTGGSGGGGGGSLGDQTGGAIDDANRI